MNGAANCPDTSVTEREQVLRRLVACSPVVPLHQWYVVTVVQTAIDDYKRHTFVFQANEVVKGITYRERHEDKTVYLL